MAAAISGLENGTGSVTHKCGIVCASNIAVATNVAPSCGTIVIGALPDRMIVNIKWWGTGGYLGGQV